jgi:cobalt/nickel transport system permease protein
MHLSDAYVSPATGLVFDGVALAIAAVATERMRRAPELARKLPLVAALAAVVFAVRLLRFPILGTAACGHVTGALLAGIIVGPEAAFLVVFAVQLVQAALFADGGLVALGVNAVNAAVWPLWVGLPIYRRLAGDGTRPARTIAGAVVASLVSAQLAAIGVVLAVGGTGRPELLSARFVGLVASAHVSLGAVEGIATAAMLIVVRRLLGVGRDAEFERAGGTAALVLLAAALFGAAVLADFASRLPEWPSWTLAEAGAEPGGTLAPVMARALELQRAIALFAGPAPPDWLGPAGGSAAGLFGAIGSAIIALLPGLVALQLRRVLDGDTGPA